MINTEELRKKIKVAEDRELNDYHFTDKERKELVDEFKKVYPEEELPEDLTEAFFEVIGW